VLSYDGRLRIACNIDPAAVPDGDRLVASLRDGLAETLGPAGAAAGVGGVTGS
jgi:hypothetical protein